MDEEDPKQGFITSNRRNQKSLSNFIKGTIVIGVLISFLLVVAILVWHTWPSVPTSTSGGYKHAAVASDAGQCSTIGKNILHDKNGSAVDAAIAALLCLGVHSAMSCGIGGGFQMVVYDTPRNSSSRTVKVFDAREVAPLAATKDMYLNGTSDTFGGAAIAVPGEVRGYYEAWKQFGKLPWKDLFQPTIDMCRNGFHVSWALASFIRENENMIRNTTGLRELFIKPDGVAYKEGDMMQRLRLADTLERIQKEPDTMYTGTLAHDVVDDIKDFDGIITREDLRAYKVKDNDSALLSMELKSLGYRLLSLRPPSSGVLLGFMLRILEGFNLTPSDIDGTSKTVEAYHKIAETFKFGYAMRSYLGDEDFVDVTKIMNNLTSYEFADYIRGRINPAHTYDNISYYNPEFTTNEEHGTSHLSIIAPNGGAVSVTTTINSVFGSKMVGKRTGIIFNDEMSDFVSPDHHSSSSLGKENFIEPRKRPMSSMCPAIIVDRNDNVVMVIGAAGGKQITSASVYVLAHNLWFGYDVGKAVDAIRIHHQLKPNYLNFEEHLPDGVLVGLLRKGHHLMPHSGFPSVVQLVKSTCHQPQHPDGCLEAVCDHRKKGTPDGF